MTEDTSTKWLLKETALCLHDLLLAEHGGSPGIRDEGLLDSALARPRNLKTHRTDVTLFELAAAYAHGIARNHPFVDGNKRVALTVAAVFLEINGWSLNASEADAVVAFTESAAGSMSEKRLAPWLEANAQPL